MDILAEADINENQPKSEVFKVFDDGFIVRRMTLEDAKIVQKWYSGLGTICSHDLNIPLSVYPPGPGFYSGEYEGEVVASAVRLPWGGKVYYGSYYYVDERFRGRGFGTRLRDQVARGHVGDNILCVDAVLGNVAKKNAAKFNYVEAFVTRRLCATAKADYGLQYSGKIVKAQEVDFDALVAFDSKHFVADNCPIRRRFLEKFIAIPDGVTYVALNESGDIVGYGTRKAAMPIQPNEHLVGPLYAESSDIAEALLQRLCQDVPGDKITINVWTPNEACLKIMDKFEFSKVFDVQRMHVNGDPKEYKDTVFAVTSIDTCGF